jgi:hypothetical protein
MGGKKANSSLNPKDGKHLLKHDGYGDERGQKPFSRES